MDSVISSVASGLCSAQSAAQAVAVVLPAVARFLESKCRLQIAVRGADAVSVVATAEISTAEVHQRDGSNVLFSTASHVALAGGFVERAVGLAKGGTSATFLALSDAEALELGVPSSDTHAEALELGVPSSDIHRAVFTSDCGTADAVLLLACAGQKPFKQAQVAQAALMTDMLSSATRRCFIEANADLEHAHSSLLLRHMARITSSAAGVQLGRAEDGSEGEGEGEGEDSARLHLESVVASVMQACYDLLHAERVSLFLTTDDGRRLLLASSQDAGGVSFSVASGIAGAAAVSGQPVCVNDAYADERFNQSVDMHTGFRTRSILATPIMQASDWAGGRPTCEPSAQQSRTDSRAGSADAQPSSADAQGQSCSSDLAAATGVSGVLQAVNRRKPGGRDWRELLGPDWSSGSSAENPRPVVPADSQAKAADDSRASYAFTPADCVILSAMASHAAGALRTAQAMEQSNRARRITAALLDVLQAANGSDTPSAGGSSSSSALLASPSAGSSSAVTLASARASSSHSAAAGGIEGRSLSSARLLDAVAAPALLPPSALLLGMPQSMMQGYAGGPGSGVTRLINRVVDAAYTLLDCERVTLFLLDPIKQELWMAVSRDAEAVHVRVPVGRGLAGAVAVTGTPLNVPDAYEDSRFDRSWDARSGFRTYSVLVWPISVSHVAAGLTSKSLQPSTGGGERRHGSGRAAAAGQQVHPASGIASFRSSAAPGLIAVLQAINKRSHSLHEMAYVALRQSQSGVAGCARDTAAPLHVPALPLHAGDSTDAVFAARLSGRSTSPHGAAAQPAPAQRYAAFDEEDEQAMAAFCSEVAVVLQKRSTESALLKAVADAHKSAALKATGSSKGAQHLKRVPTSATATATGRTGENRRSSVASSTLSSAREEAAGVDGAVVPWNTASEEVREEAARHPSRAHGPREHKGGEEEEAGEWQTEDGRAEAEEGGDGDVDPSPEELHVSLLVQYSEAGAQYAATHYALTRKSSQSSVVVPSRTRTLTGDADGTSGASEESTQASVRVGGREGDEAKGGSSEAGLPPLSSARAAGTQPQFGVAGSGSDGSVCAAGSGSGGPASRVRSLWSTAVEYADQPGWGADPGLPYFCTPPANTTGDEGLAAGAHSSQQHATGALSPELEQQLLETCGGRPAFCSWSWDVFALPLHRVPSSMGHMFGQDGHCSPYAVHPDSLSRELVASGEQRLQAAVYAMLSMTGVLGEFAIPLVALSRLLSSVRALYHPNPFHNWYHAVSVQHATFLTLQHGTVSGCLTPRDMLAALLASLGHDVDHPGTNNAFQCATLSDLALLHNDDAVLERHHAATLWRLLLASAPGEGRRGDSRGDRARAGGKRGEGKENVEGETCTAGAVRAADGSVLAALPYADLRALRRTIVHAILFTDMSKHYSAVAALIERATRHASALAEHAAVTVHGRGSGDTGGSALQQRRRSSLLLLPAVGSSSSAAGAPMPQVFHPALEADRDELVGALVHAADLSGQAYTLPSIRQNWGVRVMVEFRAQAAAERAAGLVPAPFMDTLQTPLHAARLQASFVGSILLPLWQALGDLFPSTPATHGMGPFCEPLANLRLARSDYDGEVEALEALEQGG